MFEPLSYYLIPTGLVVLAAPLLLRLSSSRKEHQQHPLASAPSSPAMPHTIVILGAGVAGVPLAHHLLKHTPPSVADIRVVLVAPNSDLLWPFATVRAILPDQLADDKIFLPLAPAFARYGRRFAHVLGSAVRVDPDAREVVVARTSDTTAAQEEVLRYDTLVVATGSAFRDAMPFKNHGGTPETKALLHTWQAAVADAKDIVVAGAGLTGIEVAGELGQVYALPGNKTVTLLAAEDLPLSADVRADVRRAAARELAKVGVRFRGGVRVVASTTSSAAAGDAEGVTSPGKTTLTLRATDGTTSTLATDLYLPALGVRANTSFLPPTLLAADGRVAVRPTLQTVARPDIFAVGDVADIESPQGIHADKQVQFLATALQSRLAGLAAPKGAGPAPALPEYKPDHGVAFGATIGPKRGAGQMAGWKIFGFLVAYIKGRYLGTDYAPNFIAGERTLTKKSW